MPPQQFPKEAAAPQQQPCLGLDGPAQLIQRSGAQCPSPALPGSLPGPVGSCVTWGLRQSCVARTAPGDGWQTEGHRLPGDPSLPVQLPLLRSAFPVSCGRAAIGGCYGPSEGRRGCGAAELCLGTSGTVETLIPFQINSPYFPTTPATQPVSQKPRSGVEFLSISGGASCGGASHPELQTSQHKTEVGAPGAPVRKGTEQGGTEAGILFSESLACSWSYCSSELCLDCGPWTGQGSLWGSLTRSRGTAVPAT